MRSQVEIWEDVNIYKYNYRINSIHNHNHRFCCDKLVLWNFSGVDYRFSLWEQLCSMNKVAEWKTIFPRPITSSMSLLEN